MKEKNYGGKANSLLKLKNNGFNVPDFFIINTEFYLEFLKSNSLFKEISNLVKNKKYQDIEKLVMSGEFNQKLQDKIFTEYNKLNSKFVSVRSSALKEDGNQKSYAGQYSTFLNVEKGDLFVSIKKCWCSLYNDNVISYSDDINVCDMNVIVQKMINPDYAGVSFTIDTTSNTNNYSIIEVVTGDGEKLVSGKITPTKFIVRRETKYTDLKIGDINLDSQLIYSLESIILDIEKLYSVPMDIEFAIKSGEIFILQARPITVFDLAVKPFILTLSRPNSLIEEELYFRGEFEGIKSITRNLYYFKPLFMYNVDNKNTDIYYNMQDLEENPNLMYYYMNLDYGIVLKRYEIVKDTVKELENIITNHIDFDLKEYIDKIIYIYPFSSLGQLSGNFENISDRLKDILYDFRFNYDYIIHKAVDYLVEKVKLKLPTQYKDFVNFILLEEVINNALPSIQELEARTRGYIYYGELFVTSNYEKWMNDNKFMINENDNSSDLKGQVVYGGNALGKVCKIFNENDFDKFQEGDILVTPMTTPKFTKLIKKAGAILTDEGGFTCHAAIISRELKVTCIVGCKNVTKVLNDGDIIKINGNTGKIQKIE